MGSSTVTDAPLCWGVLIKAKAVHMGQRVCGEPLHFPLRFAVKLQLL